MYGKKRGLITRIIAIALCAIMFLSIFVGVAFKVFAYDETEVAAPVMTGSSNTWIIFAVAGAVALVVAAICIAMRKKTK